MNLATERRTTTGRIPLPILVLAPAVLTAAVFAGTLGNGVLYDDPAALALARTPLWPLLARRFGLTYATIKLDALVWGSSLPGLHLTNVLLAGLGSALAAVCALVLSERSSVALLCGLLFAVHPVHVEAVASIENRKDLLAMIFVMASVILWCSRRRPRWGYLGSLGCLGLAMSAKDVAAVGLVGMLPLADLLLGARRMRSARARALPLLVLGVAATTWYGGNVVERLAPGAIVAVTEGLCRSYGEVLATSVSYVPDVARLLFFPLRLSADWPTRPPTTLADDRVIAGALLVAAWVATAVILRRRAPTVCYAMAWTFVMYLPLGNVVPLTTFFLAERYLYVPSFGVCLGVASALEALSRRAARRGQAWPGTIAIALSGLLVVAATARSVARTREWHDGVSLWSAALRAVPEGSGRIHGELGLALFRDGRAEEAIPQLAKALEIGPEKADFHSNLGNALLRFGRVGEAVPHLQRALAMDPGNQLIRYNLALALLQAGARDEALGHLHALLEDATWSDIAPSVSAALAERGMSVPELRAAIGRWMAANGLSAGRAP